MGFVEVSKQSHKTVFFSKWQLIGWLSSDLQPFEIIFQSVVVVVIVVLRPR